MRVALLIVAAVSLLAACTSSPAASGAVSAGNATCRGWDAGDAAAKQAIVRELLEDAELRARAVAHEQLPSHVTDVALVATVVASIDSLCEAEDPEASVRDLVRELYPSGG